MGAFLSRGIYSVISMFDPQAVLIGGGISEQEKIYLLLDKYLQRFEEWEAPGAHPSLRAG